MIGIKKATLCLALVAATSILAAPAFAEFAGTPLYSGSTTFASDEEIPLLTGYVDWAVYAPNTFPYSDPGYTPTPGQRIYVYQVFNTGNTYISKYIVPLDNSANNIGSFSDAGISGIAPWAEAPDLPMVLVTPGSASWNFTGFNPGNSSEGLIFCSPNTEIDYLAVTLNGGSYAIVDPVPVPGPESIPEPSTLLSLMVALGIIAATVRSKRR